MFVESCRILYEGSSNDLIFPATDKYPDDESYWYNLNRKARPLACVDWAEVCQSNGKCTNIDEESSPHEIEHELVREAMRKSTIFSALQYRLSKSLLAQQCVSDSISKKLSDDQWILESAALFENSLSRIQHDMYDIAIGFGHEKVPGSYVNATASWVPEGGMCNKYKFRLPHGFSNLRFGTYIAIGVVLVFFCIMACEWPGADYDDEEQRKCVGQRKKIVELAWDFGCWLLRSLGRLATKFYETTRLKAQAKIKAAREKASKNSKKQLHNEGSAANGNGAPNGTTSQRANTRVDSVPALNPDLESGRQHDEDTLESSSNPQVSSTSIRAESQGRSRSDSPSSVNLSEQPTVVHNTM